MATKKDRRCEVTVVHRAGSTVQRIGCFRDEQCNKNGTVSLFEHHFCTRHARLFAEGHIHPVTLQMEGPATMADIRRSWRRVARGAQRCCGISPFHEREVRELFGDECKRWELALGRQLAQWDTKAMQQGMALSEAIERNR